MPKQIRGGLPGGSGKGNALQEQGQGIRHRLWQLHPGVCAGGGLHGDDRGRKGDQESGDPLMGIKLGFGRYSTATLPTRVTRWLLLFSASCGESPFFCSLNSSNFTLMSSLCLSASSRAARNCWLRPSLDWKRAQ